MLGPGGARSAAACSAHPVTAHAVGEVIGQLLDAGVVPDVAVLVVSPGHAGALEDAAGAIRAVLDPSVLLGWSATEVADQFPLLARASRRPQPAIGVWVAQAGVPELLHDDVAEGSGSRGRTLTVATAGSPIVTGGGGIACRSDVAGAPLVVGAELIGAGAAGLRWDQQSPIEVLAFDGHRSVGPALTATEVVGTTVVTLDGRPAMEVLAGVARDHVPATDIALINRTIHLEVEHGAGGIGLTVPVLGRDRSSDGLALGSGLVEGSRIRFCVHDPAVARHRAAAAFAQADGALVWQVPVTSPGRPLDDADVVLATSTPIVEPGAPDGAIRALALRP